MKHLLMATTLAGVWFSQALAQDDPVDACRDVSETDAARILCLENAIRALMSGANPEAAAVAVKQDIAQVEETEVQEEAAGLGAEQVKRRQAAKDKEDKPEQEQEPAEIAAAVTEFAYTSLGNVILFLDNGQVWRQKDSDKNKVRLSGKRDYTVTVSEGMLSGYRLTVKELKRTILVERIK